MFTATLEDMVIANSAGSFSLQCQVSGDPTPTIAWFRAGDEIEGETSTTLTVSPITGTDATESGVEYYCEANNSFGRIRSRRANVQLASECDPRKVYCGSGRNTCNEGYVVRQYIPHSVMLSSSPSSIRHVDCILLIYICLTTSACTNGECISSHSFKHFISMPPNCVLVRKKQLSVAPPSLRMTGR